MEQRVESILSNRRINLGKHIECDPYHPGLGDVRLRNSGVHVWAVIGEYLGLGRSIRRTAENYDLPISNVKAAVRFYRQHTEIIENRLRANLS